MNYHLMTSSTMSWMSTSLTSTPGSPFSQRPPFDGKSSILQVDVKTTWSSMPWLFPPYVLSDNMVNYYPEAMSNL